MFEKFRRLLPSARRQAKNDRIVLYIFLALAAAVVIASSLMSSPGSGPGIAGSAVEPPTWNRLLPPGAQTMENSVVALPDEPQSAYAVGYALDRSVAVALVVWDKTNSRYVAIADRSLGKVAEGQQARIPILSTVNLAPGAVSAVMVRAMAGDQANAVMFLNRANDTLEFINMVDGKNQLRPAFFMDGQFNSTNSAGQSVSGQSSFELKDVTGDEWPEVVVSEKQTVGTTMTSVSVYVWHDGQLAFDHDLSKQMTQDAPLYVAQ